MLSVNLAFDYSYDSSNFFNTQAKKDLLQAAANSITSALGNTLSAITPGGGNTWSTNFFNPSNPGQTITLNNPTIPANTIVIYVGASTFGGTEAGLGGFGGYSNATGSAAWINTVQTRGESGTPAPFAPWGGSISFDSSAGTSWYFGTDPSGLQSNQTDFFSIAEHEIGHVLGIGTSPRWSSQVSNGFFVGPASESAHGNQPVPLDAGAGHFADGTISAGQVAVMTPVLLNGTRRTFTPLDFAALADLGWQLQTKSTTTTLAGPSTYSPVRGQTMTFYAVVSAPTPGPGAATGTVSFMSGSTVLTTAPLVTANGLTYAAMSTPPMALGTYTITTVYNGDSGHLSSLSSMTFTVGPDATTTIVGPSDFAPVRGQSLAINAIVVVQAPGSGSPTGTVTFRSGGTAIATQPVISANGLFYAQLPAVPFAMGNYSISATYNGDAGDLPSTGSTAFAVGKDATTTVAGPSNFAPVAGQPLSVNAIVAVKAPGAGTPSGTVTFKYGSTASWIVPLQTINGLTYASLPLAPLGPGTYTFTAVYNGDAADLPSSASTTFTITAGASGAPAFQAAAQPQPSATVVPPPRSSQSVVAAGASLARTRAVPTEDSTWLAALDALAAERSAAREV